MLMVDDMGGGGVDIKIIDYVDMEIYNQFLDKMFIFLIYISKTKLLNIQEVSKMIGYIM